MLACEQVMAQYAAVGVLDDEGNLEKFIPVGMTLKSIQKMAHQPQGRGLIGALMNSTDPIRLANLHNDPRSSGFPDHHPQMTSFLGIPIRQGDRQVGQIYLTNKLTGAEFTEDDEQVMETMAAYAAVAISNARFYRQITERDNALTRRSENLALVNELASVLTSSDKIDQVLEKVLTQVIDYLRLDVGEVFLRKEDGKVLQLALHRGEGIPSLWARSEFLFGEGVVGETAQKGLLNQIDLQAMREGAYLDGHFLTQRSCQANSTKLFACR